MAWVEGDGFHLALLMALSDNMYMDVNVDVELTVEKALPDAAFAECHRRNIALPIDDVWAAARAITGPEIRLLWPFMKLREIPAKFSRDREAIEFDGSGSDRPFLDEFAAQGAVILREDVSVVDGRAAVIFGVAGKFWKPVGNTPTTFEGPEEFLAFDESNHARFVASLEVQQRDGHVELTTQTLVKGTDRSANIKFAPYWAIIRGPSGLIRRSWLAGIERRAASSGETELVTPAMAVES